MTNNSTLTFFKEGVVQYMIELSQKQIKQIARSISVLDIKAYIEQHRQEFEEFLKKEEESKKAER